MATYIATNVQGFEDAGTGDIYVVRANLSDSVTGGITITAYSGVAPTFAAALGAHQSTTGSGSGITVADPGSISIATGALAYTTTCRTVWSVSMARRDSRPSARDLTRPSKSDAAYAVHGSAGTVRSAMDLVLQLNAAHVARHGARTQSSEAVKEKPRQTGYAVDGALSCPHVCSVLPRGDARVRLAEGY